LNLKTNYLSGDGNLSHKLTFAALHRYNSAQVGIEVPIRLRVGAQEIQLVAKLDTGASGCLFEREYGELLGLDIETGPMVTFSSAMGLFDAYGHEVRLIALGMEFDLTVYFFRFPGANRNVLGRQGWLQKLRIGIVDYDGSLFLSHHDDVFDDD
jgi:hypothetical protein